MSTVVTTSPGLPAYQNASGVVVIRNEGTVGEVVDPNTQETVLPGKSIFLRPGQFIWYPSTGDRTDEITATADLATLKADGTDGDGNFGGGAFGLLQFVVLDDLTVATYNGTIWSEIV